MADTTFVNGTTLTDADWFNDVNRLHYTIFADAADAAAARTALGVAIGTDVQAFAAAASQAEAEAGTEAGLRTWSPLRVAQAIAALADKSAGDVLQVVYATDAGSNTASGSLTNITSGVKSITPKSSNSTLIVECTFDATVAAGGAGTNTTGVFQLYNNTSGANIGQQFSLGVVSGAGTNVQTQGPGAIAALVTNAATTPIDFILRAKYGTAACTVTGANHVWKITEVQN